MKTFTSKFVIHLLSFLISIVPITNFSAQVNPVQLGRASNIFSIVRPNQNQVYTNDRIDLVTFIHRQDITVWGGGDSSSGVFRYDISLDRGNTFTTDIGPLNPINIYGRYPQITGLDPIGLSALRDERFMFAGTTIDNGNWEALLGGLAVATTSNPISRSTERKYFTNEQTLIFGGLSKGRENQFWTVCSSFNGSTVGDSLYVVKGIYSSFLDNISWSIQDIIQFEHFTDYDGFPKMILPNISFSPDGETGWIGFLGDLDEGMDSIHSPILIPTFDGGTTWGSPIEVNLSELDFLSDSRSLIQELRDELYRPPSEGLPTCAFEFDMTVDKNGNPHFFVVVGSATDMDNPTPGYSLRSQYVKLALDIFSTDQGKSWKAYTVAPIYTFRTQVGIGDPQSMDNYIQVARNKTGDHIFYSWVDSDTTGYAGSSENNDPNLRISSLRLADNYITCPKWITLNDPTWDGNMYFPTMAPEVLETRNGYQLPIVSVKLLTDNTLEPVQFWYFGNDATIDHANYEVHYSLLNTDSCFFNCDYNNLTAGFERQIENFQVQFTDTSSTILPILTWNWQFGDGNISADQNPIHTYSAQGTYDVQLIVTTDCDIDAAIIPVSVPDSDGDGVPDGIDVCAFGDDLKDENSNSIPDDCECQSIDLITASLITQDTVYIIRDQIISSDTLQNTIQVIYKAGESITLSSGFEVKKNVTFIAAPVGCEQALGMIPEEEIRILKENPDKMVIDLRKN